MLILVYKITDQFTRSVSRATLVDEVEVSKMPAGRRGTVRASGGCTQYGQNV